MRLLIAAANDLIIRTSRHQDRRYHGLTVTQDLHPLRLRGCHMQETDGQRNVMTASSDRVPAVRRGRRASPQPAGGLHSHWQDPTIVDDQDDQGIIETAGVEKRAPYAVLAATALLHKVNRHRPDPNWTGFCASRTLAAATSTVDSPLAPLHICNRGDWSTVAQSFGLQSRGTCHCQTRFDSEVAGM